MGSVWYLLASTFLICNKKVVSSVVVVVSLSLYGKRENELQLGAAASDK